MTIADPAESNADIYECNETFFLNGRLDFIRNSVSSDSGKMNVKTRISALKIMDRISRRLGRDVLSSIRVVATNHRHEGFVLNSDRYSITYGLVGNNAYQIVNTETGRVNKCWTMADVDEALGLIAY